MGFSHDVEHSLFLAVDLVNTDPGIAGVDLLPDLTTLGSFVRTHRVSDVGVLGEGDLASVHALRVRFRELFLASSTEHAAKLVNQLLKDAHLCPRLTDHDGYDWHIHYFAPGSKVADHLLIDGGMAMSFVVVSGEHERMRVCEAPDCERVLVDLSRNRSKRYCDSRTCGNRLHVAAYRQRQRAMAAS